MKKIHLLFLILISILFACDLNSEDSTENEEIPKNIMEIIQNGITIDSIQIAYAEIDSTSLDFPVIHPLNEDSLGKSQKINLYFSFHSQNRKELFEYYSKVDKKNAEQGFTVDREVLYADTLKNISIRVQVIEGVYQQLPEVISSLKIIPSPEINSGHTFALYQMTLEEFLKESEYFLPDYFLIGIDGDAGLEANNTYTFEIKFSFSNAKEYTLYSVPIHR